MRLFPQLAVVLSVTAPSLAARQIEGPWTGAIRIQGIELGIVVTFTTDDSLTATIDIPQQQAAGVPLEAVRHDPPTVHFELPSPIGRAIFDGEMAGDSITGRFTQGPNTATFYLTRGGGEPPAASARGIHSRILHRFSHPDPSRIRPDTR